MCSFCKVYSKSYTCCHRSTPHRPRYVCHNQYIVVINNIIRQSLPLLFKNGIVTMIAVIHILFSNIIREQSRRINLLFSSTYISKISTKSFVVVFCKSRAIVIHCLWGNSLIINIAPLVRRHHGFYYRQICSKLRQSLSICSIG